MPANVEEMFSAVSPPWHKLGTVTEGAQTAEQVVEVVPELGALVEPYELYWKSDLFTGPAVLPGRVLNVRNAFVKDGVEHPQKPLGIVGDGYLISQTVDQFAALDKLVEGEQLLYETAGSIRDGRVHWLLTRMPEGLEVVGDEVIPYILVVNSFDGSRALTWATTPVRVVCQNTLSLALGSKATRKFALRHRSGLHDRFEDVQKALGLSAGHIEALADWAEMAVRTSVSEKQIRRVIGNAIPLPPVDKSGKGARGRYNAGQRRLLVRDLLAEADNLAEHRNNAWGLYNAIVQFNDHEALKVKGADDPSADPTKVTRRRERRMQKIMIDTTDTVQRAEKAITALLR